MSSLIEGISQMNNSTVNSQTSEETSTSQVVSSTPAVSQNQSSASSEKLVTSSSKPSTVAKPSTPAKPYVPQSTNNGGGDATQANNNKVNEFIQSQLPSKGDITQADIDRVINELVKMDGVTFHNVNSINDKVTMINLYYEPMEGKFKDLDTRVMNSLKSGRAETIRTGYAGDDSGTAVMQEYANALYWKNTVQIDSFSIESTSTKSEIIFDTAPLIEQKRALENKSYYKAIQQAIKECGIYNGMLQRDAIVKFNNYICNKVQYDYEGYTAKLEDFFGKGKAICNSYAQVFEILCRTVGIDAQFMGGNVNVVGSSEPHAWNRVNFLGNKTAYFDTCWNDGTITINGKVYQKTDRYMFVKSFSDRSVANLNICQAVGYSGKFV